MQGEAIARRSVIAGSIALTACMTGRGASRPRLGLADITVMAPLRKDYAGTLRLAAAMGYTVFGFRLQGYGGREPGEPSPVEKARMARAAGLDVGVVRLGVRNADYDRDLADAAEAGASIVALSVAPPFISGPRMFETTRERLEAWLPSLAALGEKARAHGLTLAYHNHWFDLRPIDGERPLDLIARQIPPRILSFEIDLAWAWYAGVDPVGLLRALGPRVVSMHWKDVDRARGKTITDHAVAPGLGEMNYAALLPAIAAVTRATGYVEVDSPDDGIAAARAGAETVHKALRWTKA